MALTSSTWGVLDDGQDAPDREAVVVVAHHPSEEAGFIYECGPAPAS